MRSFPRPLAAPAAATAEAMRARVRGERLVGSAGSGAEMASAFALAT